MTTTETTPATIEELREFADRYFPGPLNLTPDQIERLRTIFAGGAA